MLYCIKAIHCKGNEVENTRIFGVFTEDHLDEARNIIINNKTDLFEYYYKYIVLFKIPENSLYVDCRTELFETYEVYLPADVDWKDNKACRENGDRIKFNKIEKEDTPKEILKLFSWLDAEGNISREMKADGGY